MADEDLFGGLPEEKSQGEAIGRSAPRLLEPKRDQIELRAVDIESLIGKDHPARVIWDYVDELDLSELEKRIKARADRPGHPATSPRLLLALWLVATSDGAGSARALERLCEHHDVYRWLCGGVSVNHHTLSDFRVGNADLLDRLLAEHLAALAKAKLVDLDTLAQDGVRIRASAGAASFRREATLDKHLAVAEAVVEQLKQEVDANLDASNQRIKAARERAARERNERIKAAKAALDEIKAQREQREKKRGNGKKPKEPRASTTDPDARVMKMADGGFRPAYNFQFCTATNSQVILGVDVETTGSDAGQAVPMVEQVEERYEATPGEVLIDGGFAQHDQIEALEAPEKGCTVYAPVPAPRDPKVDRFAPKPGDSPAVAAWRTRMAAEEAKTIYKERAATAECVNAQARNRGLLQLRVRGRVKVKAVALWYALAHNLMRAVSLRAAVAGTT